MEAGWGQVLAPRVLALLTRSVAEVSGLLCLGEGGGRGQVTAVAAAQLTPPTFSPRAQLKGGSPGPELEEVALHALLLCEGLFDPYQAWRRRHQG